MRADQENVINIENENTALRTLISHLIYNGIDRGYVRGSVMWADQVRASARDACLSDADVSVLLDAEMGGDLIEAFGVRAAGG